MENKISRKIEVFIIAYSKEILAAIEPGYLALDNIENKRPDWREYWPIRNYLLKHDLNEDTYYGFFSPRFREKTNINYEQLKDFINSGPIGTDVFTISPQVDIGAFFQNVYYGGELMSPGFLDASQRLFDRNDVEVSIGSLFMDTRTTVFSNYIVAKPIFWREWIRLGEMLFAAAENADLNDSLRQKLNLNTPYSGSVERKVFLMEAQASLVLNIHKNMRVHAYDPFKLCWSSQLGNFKQEAITCDALKTAVIEQGRNTYRETFREISNQVLQKANLQALDPYMLKTELFDQYNPTDLQLIPNNITKIVEFGCMRGTLANEYLKNQPNCQWIGIDIDPDYIKAAEKICHKAICLDVEKMSLEKLAEFSDCEIWIFGDLLDRLIDPWGLLNRIRDVVNPGTKIIASITNAQHWSFQARLNMGNIRYEEHTSLDKSNIRIFTRTTLFEMIQNAGFKVLQGITQNKNHPDMAKYMPAMRMMAEANNFDPEVAIADSLAFKISICAGVI